MHLGGWGGRALPLKRGDRLGLRALAPLPPEPRLQVVIESAAQSSRKLCLQEARDLCPSLWGLRPQTPKVDAHKAYTGLREEIQV